MRFKPFLLPVSIFLIILASLFFLKPRMVEIIEIQKNLSQARERLTQLTAKASQLEKLGQTELAAKTELVLKALPSKKDIPQILFTLRELSREVGVDLQGVQVDPGELSLPQEKEGRLIFEAKIKGEKEKIRVFLERVESTFPLMKLEKFSLSQEGGGGIEAVVVLNAFFLSLPKELGTVEQPLALITPQEEDIYQVITKFKPLQKEEGLMTIQVGKENPFKL